MPSKSRVQLNAWLKTLRIKGSVLDVGVQNKPVRKLLGHCDAPVYHTLDNDEQWNPDVLCDLNEPLDESLFDQTYDNIFALEVFEHLWNPIEALKTLAKLSHSGTKLHLSWPFINPVHDYFDFARYTEEGMAKLLSVTGWKVIMTKYRLATVGKDELMSFWSKEGLRVSKIRPPRDHKMKHVIGFMMIAEKC